VYISARNSEVIHSGEHGLSTGATLADELRDIVGQAGSFSTSVAHVCSYPVGSLKSQLCIRGRDLLYARCTALGIGHRKTQKASGHGNVAT
jgi:L-2-hydroxyglutarate oxidase LhgO